MRTAAAPAVCISPMAMRSARAHRLAATRTMHTQRKYRAPALERGLEIVELLASASSPMNLTEICAQLGRNPNELFRMMQVLEKRHFIQRRDSMGAYELTDKIFELAIAQTHGPA